MKRFLIIAAALSLAGCGEDEARRALDAYGFTDVELTGYRWLGCSENDTVRDGFNATNMRGKRVSGVVCAQAFGKSATVRID